ncbi:MAG TPA: hypothetical protein VMU12_00170 [Candidatus Paceibacterota bacterium]|nr:hypothetical protein [Candidatus Paceibacterota bacterium]
MNYSSLVKSGVRNAVGVIAYVLVIAVFFSNAQRLFGDKPMTGAAGPMLMLLLLVVSALITGSLVLWQPAKLLADGKKAEAGTLLCVTGGTLVIALVVIFMIALLTR